MEDNEFWLTALTVSQQLLRHQVVLAVAQNEGQEGEDEGVHDAHDGQDVGPADRAGAQRVLVRLLAAHPLHLVAVPAVGVDHAAQNQTGAWNRRGNRWVSVAQRAAGGRKKKTGDDLKKKKKAALSTGSNHGLLALFVEDDSWLLPHQSLA